MNKNFKLFCFGFGQVAKCFVKNLIKNNYNFQLVTTNTTKTKLEKIHNLKYKSYYFNNNKFDKNLIKDLKNSNKILISIPPKKKIEIVSKLFENNFKDSKFNWVTYLSATNVYGDRKGKWVNEKTKPIPKSDRGIARLNAEKKWMKFYKDFNLPIQIFRLSGIYSSENNIITRLKSKKIKLVIKKKHFFSRIHLEDIAQILIVSLKKFRPGEVYNISDNYPCSNVEIMKYASRIMNIENPKKIKVNEIKNRKLKDFYKDSKKVNNRKMKSFFKYSLKYPSYKEGLIAVKNNMI